MPRYNSYVDITSIEDDTIKMRIEIKNQVFKDYKSGWHHVVVYDAVTPFLDDVERFLEEARKWVHLIKSTDADYEAATEDEILRFYINESQFIRDYDY